MITPQRSSLSTMDGILSKDPVLSALGTLFPTPALPSELVECPRQPQVAARSRGRLRWDLFAKPEIIAVAAAIVLIACVVAGCLLNSGIIAAAGVGATLMLGVCCHFALKRARTHEPMGTRVQQ